MVQMTKIYECLIRSEQIAYKGLDQIMQFMSTSENGQSKYYWKFSKNQTIRNLYHFFAKHTSKKIFPDWLFFDNLYENNLSVTKNFKTAKKIIYLIASYYYFNVQYYFNQMVVTLEQYLRINFVQNKSTTSAQNSFTGWNDFNKHLVVNLLISTKETSDIILLMSNFFLTLEKSSLGIDRVKPSIIKNANYMQKMCNFFLNTSYYWVSHQYKFTNEELTRTNTLSKENNIEAFVNLKNGLFSFIIVTDKPPTIVPLNSALNGELAADYTEDEFENAISQYKTLLKSMTSEQILTELKVLLIGLSEANTTAFEGLDQIATFIPFKTKNFSGGWQLHHQKSIKDIYIFFANRTSCYLFPKWEIWIEYFKSKTFIYSKLTSLEFAVTHKVITLSWFYVYCKAQFNICKIATILEHYLQENFVNNNNSFTNWRSENTNLIVNTLLEMCWLTIPNIVSETILSDTKGYLHILKNKAPEIIKNAQYMRKICDKLSYLYNLVTKYYDISNDRLLADIYTQKILYLDAKTGKWIFIIPATTNPIISPKNIKFKNFFK